MSSQYDAVATRALATITRKGSAVTFGTTTGGIYDPTMDTWTGGTVSTVTGRAVQIEDDPQRYLARGLIVTNPITLLVAADGLDSRPVPGMTFTWSGVTYTISRGGVEALDPAGDGPILFTVIGDV